jgi:hypothetical protein
MSQVASVLGCSAQTARNLGPASSGFFECVSVTHGTERHWCQIELSSIVAYVAYQDAKGHAMGRQGPWSVKGAKDSPEAFQAWVEANGGAERIYHVRYLDGESVS